MKDKIKVELNKYELGILLNALLDFRNKKLKEKINTESIDDLYIKFVNCYDRFQNQSSLLGLIRQDNVR